MSNIVVQIKANVFSRTKEIFIKLIYFLFVYNFISLYVINLFEIQSFVLLLILAQCLVIYRLITTLNNTKYVKECSFVENDCIDIEYSNIIGNKELHKIISYDKLLFTYYQKMDSLFTRPLILSLYDGKDLIVEIKKNHCGWNNLLMEQLYDEISLRTLPYTKDLKPEIPVKIKGTSKRRKQFPNTRPYCE